MRSVIRSKRLVLPPIRLVASATAIRSAGKNARKRLKAIACEIMLHRGNTLANVRYARRRSLATGFIAGHYTCLSHLVFEATETLDNAQEILRRIREVRTLYGPGMGAGCSHLVALILT